MRSCCIILLMACLLSACGGGAAPSGAPSGGAAGQADATSVAPPTPTPDNTIATAVPGALNDSFATALAISEPLKSSVKESAQLYYKIDVPRGGIITGTLAVDAGSPAPLSLTLYDEKQGYLADVNVPVGQSASLSHIFDSTGGGTTYLRVSGDASFRLEAQTASQRDAAAEGDAPAEFKEARLIKPGSYTGLLGGTDQRDTYSVDLPKGGGVLSATLQSKGAQADQVKLTIFNSDQGYVADAQTTASDSTPAALRHVLNSDDGGRWFLQIDGNGAYALTVQFTAQNDAASGKDAPGDFNQALPIKPGSYTGLLGDADLRDTYSVDLPRSGGVLSTTIQSTGQATDQVKLTLFNSQQGYVGDIQATGSEATLAGLQHILPLDEGGRWFIQLEGSGSYALTIQFTAQNDAASGKDASGEQAKPLVISSASFSGQIGDEDRSDFYRISASQGHTVKVTYVSGSGELKATLFRTDGGYITDQSVGEVGQSVEVKDTEDGDYVLAIQDANASYSVEISP